MSKDLYLDHRGALTGLVGLGDVLVFTTEHPEGQATAVFRINPTTGALTSEALPTGIRALVATASTLWVAGADGHVRHAPLAGGAFATFGAQLDPAPAALAPLADDRLAVATGAVVRVLDAGGKEVQQFELAEAVAVLAADPTGQWLAAGTVRGTVQILECEEKPAFVLAEQGRLHEGAVTAILFDPEGLRFLSAGVDRKLLLTHARGALEPEDRGGKQGHDDAVTAILNTGERFYTGGRDGQLKVWTRDRTNRRSQTLKSGAGTAVALAEVLYVGKPHIAVAADDATIRIFQVDGTGKPVLKVAHLHDAYAKARNAFTQREPGRRQQALRTLAGYNDAAGIALLAERAEADDDLTLRIEATTALGESGNPRAVEKLEGLLKARSPEVRLAALAGLRTLKGQADTDPLDLAIRSGQANVGVAAIEALTALANADDQAQVRIVRALDDTTREVRFAALEALEALGTADDPDASLQALTSRHADLRWHALLRLYQRALLDRPTVQSAVRRHGEDGDGRVRQIAFHLAVLARPNLAAVLRYRDRDLHRQLHQLETFGKEAAEPAAPRKVNLDTLTAEDRQPLLEAMASRALDTCVQGAVQLARIQDGRALGTLLQLSRESDEGTRVAACRALESQGDPRALQRLRQMLRDGAEAVRDAAYSAVARLLEREPLAAAEAGLSAQHEDVRRRGLRQLVKVLKSDAGPVALGLLGRALNDVAPAVRTEAFKTALNLPVGGTAEAALRFALQSLHADLRREVLTEAMAEVAQPWAWGLLLDLFDDPDSGVRREALEFARKKGKGRDPDPLARALQSPHADLRLEATTQLSKKSNAAARALLIETLSDADRDVRLAALQALEAAGEEDALRAALASPHADVRIRTASALAAAGDVAAADALLLQLAEARPDVADLRRLWQQRVIQAFEGLSALGDGRAVAPALGFLSSDDGGLRLAAARALAWTCPAGELTPLRATLLNADNAVKVAAALGLAWQGDSTGAALLAPPTPPPAPVRGKRVATPPAAPAAAPTDALAAAIALGDRDGLLAWLDVSDEKLRRRAVLLLLMVEWREADGTPDRCLAALSSSDPRVRLTAAEALEFFADSSAFGAALVRMLNTRGEGQSLWTLTVEDVALWADALAFGHGRLQVRAAGLFDALEFREQAEFDLVFSRFARRFGAEIKTRADAARAAATAPEAYTPEAIRDLMVGAYVGLSRISGGANAKVRQTALSRLAAAVAAGKADAGILAPVFLQALRDEYAAVRAQAFEHLAAQGYGTTRLAAEALATGHKDVGILGLKLLAGQAGDAAGSAVLREVLVTRIDGLEHEAATLLGERIGPAAALQAGLDARSEARRRQSVDGLAELGDADALAALRQALASRFEAVRDQAAIALAKRRDPSSFEPLVRMLARADRRVQRDAVAALAALGDARAPGAFLDRLVNDVHGTADASLLLGTAGRFRRVEDAARLVPLIERPATRSAAFGALLTISGYDQSIEADEDAEVEDDRWLAEQHPRHDAVLVQLLRLAHGLGEAGLARQLMAGARWSRSAEVGETLALFAGFGDERVRHLAVNALGWRLRKRGGSPEPLVAALAHADAQTAFFAAYGLALAGRADGITTLLSAVDLGDSVDQRSKAVEALGELADPRALDVLLRILDEDGHALQEAAAEAIGHLRATDRADRIFKILARLAASEMEGVALQALTGLRWFGGVEAWRIVRERAKDGGWRIRERVAMLLGHHDDDAARATLLDLARTDDDRDVAIAAAASLRRLYGPESLEPDFAFLESCTDDLDEHFLERLAERGDAARILATLPKIPEDQAETRVEPLVNALLERTPLPLAAAASAVASPHHRAGAVAARILGQAGPAAAAHGDALAAATGQYLAAWRARRTWLEDARRGQDTELDGLTDRLRPLIWACGRLGVGAQWVVDAAGADGHRPEGRPIREAATSALADGLGGAQGLDALAAIAVGPDADLRTLAAAALARRAPERATALLERALDDRPSLDRLLVGADATVAQATLRSAATRVHVQGVALPYLIARGDVEGLVAAVNDEGLDETARFGAVEALARIATAPAQAALSAVGAAAGNDEALRKAAFKALRRAKRQGASA